METRNNVESAYARLNNAAKLTFSEDDWITLLSSLGVGLGIVIPTLTGIPSKYATPATLFAVLTVFNFVRHRADHWLRRAVINVAGCAVLYAILAVLDSKR